MQTDFDVDEVLRRPLMAYIATSSPDGPRDSPVWFLWEDKALWVIGTKVDSFVRRLEAEPRCAVSVVDFDVDQGVLRHVGIRGVAKIESIDQGRLGRLLSRYLGYDRTAWNAWFVRNVVDPLDVMIRIAPATVVAKELSYFKTGPNYASRSLEEPRRDR